MFVKHQEAELSEDEVGRILKGSKIKTQVKVCKCKDFQKCFCKKSLMLKYACPHLFDHKYYKRVICEWMNDAFI